MKKIIIFLNHVYFIKRYWSAFDFASFNGFFLGVSKTYFWTYIVLYSIYTVVNEGGTFYLYSINTENMTGTRITFPYMINGFISNFPYIAYSPDASTVSILNYGEDGKLTAFFNPNYPETVSSVNSAGGELTQYSHTKSAFIG